jgi:hypothetical protein
VLCDATPSWLDPRSGVTWLRSGDQGPRPPDRQLASPEGAAGSVIAPLGRARETFLLSSPWRAAVDPWMDGLIDAAGVRLKRRLLIIGRL